MNLIIMGRRSGRPWHVELKRPVALAVLAGVLLTVAGGAFTIGRQLGEQTAANQPALQVAAWSKQLAAQESQIGEMNRKVQEHINALAKRVGLMNAHIIRLD